MSTHLIINDRADKVEGHIHTYDRPINVIAVSYQIDDGSEYAYRVSFDPVTGKFTIQDLNTTNYLEVRMVR